jgi:hypothetical protein
MSAALDNPQTNNQLLLEEVDASEREKLETLYARTMALEIPGFIIRQAIGPVELGRAQGFVSQDYDNFSDSLVGLHDTAHAVLEQLTGESFEPSKPKNTVELGTPTNWISTQPFKFNGNKGVGRHVDDSGFGIRPPEGLHSVAHNTVIEGSAAVEMATAHLPNDPKQSYTVDATTYSGTLQPGDTAVFRAHGKHPTEHKFTNLTTGPSGNRVSAVFDVKPAGTSSN